MITELRNLPMVSVTKNTIDITNAIGVRNKKKQLKLQKLIVDSLFSEEDERLNDTNKVFVPDYEACWLLAVSSGIDISRLVSNSERPGYKLLELRANNQMKNESASSMTQKLHLFQNKWNKCLKKAQTRERR